MCPARPTRAEGLEGVSYIFSTYRLYQASGFRRNAMSDEWLQCSMGMTRFFAPDGFFLGFQGLPLEESRSKGSPWSSFFFGFAFDMPRVYHRIWSVMQAGTCKFINKGGKYLVCHVRTFGLQIDGES